MPLTAISIQGYRSIQRLHFDVDACSIFVGANGVGKTNLYKALGLLRAAADGTLTRAIAQEGGIESVLWAGRRPGNKPVRMILSAHFEDLEYGVEVGLPRTYEVEVGLPKCTEAAFRIEPLVKEAPSSRALVSAKWS
jgi:predicted ATPase